MGCSVSWMQPILYIMFVYENETDVYAPMVLVRERKTQNYRFHTKMFEKSNHNQWLRPFRLIEVTVAQIIFTITIFRMKLSKSVTSAILTINTNLDFPANNVHHIHFFAFYPFKPSLSQVTYFLYQTTR